MTEAARESVIEFHDIGKRYGDFQALRGVSFDVARGGVFGLLGPNGAGKTTLIRILLDILRADSGSISVFGEAHHRGLLDRIGYLPEERGLYTKHKIIDVMIYFGQLKGLSKHEARERSRHWLARFDLAEAENWKVERLSKGMSQKVQIAVTLLSEPELCVLDEPFSGLDPVNVRLVQEMIDERRKAGRSTILSTHQMNMVETLCDDVALIHRGELMVYGGVDEVRQRFSPSEVRVGVRGDLPPLEGVETTTREENSWRLRLGDGTKPGDVLTALVRAGTDVDHFEKILAPMDEIFVHVVKGGTA